MNYFWNANGIYEKRNIIEYFDNIRFENNSLCLDDVCLTNDDIIYLKYLKNNNKKNIINEINRKDNLTKLEIINYLNEIFKLVYNEKNNEKKLLIIEKYFSYGYIDIRNNNIINFNDVYLNINFLDLIQKINKLEIINNSLNFDKIKNIISKNRIDDDSQEIKKVILVKNYNKNKILNINNKYYITHLNMKIFFELYKVNINNNNIWKIIYTTQELLNNSIEKINNLFNLSFKTQLNEINEINLKNSLDKKLFQLLVDRIKSISIFENIFNFNIFKENIFIKYYKDQLDLSIIDENSFNNIIYDSNYFKSDTLNEINLNELKTNLGNSVYDIKSKYYILDESNIEPKNYIYLIKINKIDTNESNYKWNILYIKENLKII